MYIGEQHVDFGKTRIEFRGSGGAFLSLRRAPLSKERPAQAGMRLPRI